MPITDLITCKICTVSNDSIKPTTDSLPEAKTTTHSSNSAREMNVSEMKRGNGGRIEDAFASAKSKGEAAFVSFLTAGYPSAKGE